MSEPIYDEDIVNLGYLKKVISDTEENIDDIYKNVSRHYASKPQPPYNKGDTWIDGDIVYVCINSRQIGLYTDSDWVTESGAREEVKNKNKTYLKQPSNYSPGDMWILQSDNDHKAGKKGEILISTAGRAEYDEGDWINMLGYGTIRSINEVADNLNNAINRIGNVEEAIEDGIIITFYQDSEPEGKHIGDLWYVTGEIEGYTKGKIYRYDGTSWVILDDPAIQKAFDEANEARIVADGKIQSFYSATEPTQNVGVGDLWIDIDNNNQLYRYNGTKWVAVYDTRINELVVNVETVTERVATIETDLGEIDLKVKETTTTITTIQGDVGSIQDNLTEMGTNTIYSVDVMYALSDSETTAPTEGWNTTAPQWQNGKYMWQKTVTTYANGDVSESQPTCITGAQGEAGKDGTSVNILGSYDTIEDLKVEHPTGNIGDAYIIAGDLYVWSENSSEWTNVGTIQGPKGEQGIQGNTGANGQTSYLHIKYSNDEGNTFTDNNGEVPGDYIGQYVDFVEKDSADTSKYKWKKIKGEQGIQGLQGLQGEKGEQGIQGPKGETGDTGKAGTDGQTSYFHIKYSSVPNPTADQMSENPDKYIGTYVDFEQDDSTEPNRYTWYKVVGDDGKEGIQGPQGEQGIPGTNGEDGKTSYLHIKYSNDNGETFTNNNGETVGNYIGQYVDFIKEDSTNVSDYKWAKIEGQKGDTGIGVEEVVEQYYLSTSDSSQTGGQWKETQDEWVEGTHIWTRSKVTWTDGNITYTTPVLANAINNANSNASNALDQAGNIIKTKGESEGKLIHIEDSAEEPLVDISLHGETSQKTRSGKNLLNVNMESQVLNGITFTVNDDKSITISGTATARTEPKLWTNKNSDLILISGTTYYNHTGDILYLHANNNYYAIQDNGSLTPTEDLIVSFMYIRVENETMIDKTIYPMLTTTTDATYEQYGAMPSPEFPSEIQNVGNDVNLFDKNNYNELNANLDNLTYKETERTLYFKCEKNTSYSFQKLLGTSYKRMIVAETIELPTYNVTCQNMKNLIETNSNFYTTSDTAEYIVFWYYCTGSDLTQQEILDSIKIQKGTVATAYSEYGKGTVQIKITGKNLFDKNNITSGKIINRSDGTTSSNASYGVSDYILVKPNTTYTEYAFNVWYTACYDENYNYLGYVDNSTTFTTLDNTKYIRMSFLLEHLDIAQLEEGTTSTDCEPYKSQTVSFPLIEGQKLMEGSYLADDGVHNNRIQTEVNITSTATLGNGNKVGVFNTPNKISKYNNMLACSKAIFTPSGHSLIYKEGTVYENLENVCFVGNSNDTLATLQEKYNGAILEYELAEEEIVPYTEEQQKAWNKIKALTTYKNITNITSDAYAEIIYIRDNGLDIYETKQDAENKYTETIEKFAEQKITVDGVITQVSDTNKRLTNEYLTAEQVNAELDTTNENIEILSQKQAKTELTSEQFRIEIDKIVNEGVSKVKTSMGYTFDDEGFKLDREGAETGTIIDEAKIKVVDKTGSSETDLLYAGYVKEGNTDYPNYVGQTIVASANMIVQNYLVVPNSRFEKYENPVLGGQGTGVFGV